MTETTRKEIQQKLTGHLERWRTIEDKSARSAAEIAKSSDHPVLRTVMQIIESDSRRHAEVQQFVIDSLTERAVSLTPEDLADVWDRIEEHVALERKMIDEVRASLDAVAGKQLMVQEYLLRYLLADERKHDQMLSDLDAIKRGMVPYGS